MFQLSITAIGGPHSHIPMFIRHLVIRRRYISEEEFLELHALGQIIPGPASTQTITAIAYKIGGPNLAYLTLIIWVMPSMILMTAAAIVITYFSSHHLSLDFTKFIAPMAVAFVSYAAWIICTKVIESKTAIIIMIISSVISFFLRSPYITPILLLAGGITTTFKYSRLPKSDDEKPIDIKWANFVLFISVFLITFFIGIVTKAVPVKLFESFYRNGAMIFGGGQVLIPLLHSEYVELKQYLTSEEFLFGYAFVQAIPGPVFSISSYIGALSMRQYGISGQLLGSLLSAAGIFLPGTFLIFFIYRIWNNLKKYRFIKASLEGINAVSSGLVVGVAIFLYQTVELNLVNITIMLITFLALLSEKVPTPIIVVLGIGAGFFL
ncbi:MAG: chromate efflux transporter [Cytophagales bacterium]|nr:chromate efflux transporter [Cytophagales bacterium]